VSMNKEEIIQLYGKFVMLANNRELNQIITESLDLLKENNVFIDGQIVGVEVDHTSDGYEKFIVIKLFSEYGIKATIKIGSRGFFTRYLEGANECECSCGD